MNTAEEVQNGKKSNRTRDLVSEATEPSSHIQGDATGKNSAPNNTINPNDQPGQSREHELHLPIANVVRIMRKGLPSHAKVADETKDMMQECVSEFISFITSEANDKCQKEHRKTVTAEDLIGAMARLGFDHYVEPLMMYLQKYRENEMLPMTTRFNLPQGSNTTPGYDFVPRPAGYMLPTCNGLLPTCNGLPPFANMINPQYTMFGYSGNGVYYHDGSGQISGRGSMGQDSAAATVHGGNNPISGTGNMGQDSATATTHGGNEPSLALANRGAQCAADRGGSSSESPPAKKAFYNQYGQYE